MLKTRPGKSDTNSKWVIWAGEKARGVRGFDLKMGLRKLCSLGCMSFLGRMYTPYPVCPKG